MLSKKELMNSPEYWVEELQNQIYREVLDYMQSKDWNRTTLAKEWGVSKGYVTQILSGECNFSLQKWVELSLKMQKAPVVEYLDTKDIYEMDNVSKMVNEQVNKPLLLNYSNNSKWFSIKSDQFTFKILDTTIEYIIPSGKSQEAA